MIQGGFGREESIPHKLLHCIVDMRGIENIMQKQLKNIYGQLPSYLQNCIDEIWYCLPQDFKFGSAYSKMLNLLIEKDGWSKDKIDFWRNEEIRKVLIHAYNTCPFYNKHFKAAGFNPMTYRYIEDLENIPPINKDIVQDNLVDMLSNAFSSKDRVFLTTGGTTGKQMSFYNQRRVTFAKEKAFYDYLWSKVGYMAGKSEKVVLRNNVLKDRLWKYNYREHTWIIDTYHLTDENCRKIITKLNELKIEFFHVYPSAVLCLAEYMHRHNDYLLYTPTAIFATSENLYKGQREIIESAFNCRMMMSYGHSEMCSLASQCLSGDHYHIEEMYGYTELLDENQETIKKVGKKGEITATGFNNYVMPLIRYRTADYAEYGEEDNCGDGRVLRNIDGRWLQEMLVTSQGNKISMTAINFHSDVFDNVKFYQFYQDAPGLVTMKIVKEKSYEAKDEHAIKEAMQEKLGKYLALAIEYVDEIEKAPNGKFRYIISKL